MAGKKSLTRGQRAAQTRAASKAAKSIHAAADEHGEALNKAQELRITEIPREEWVATERSTSAEETLYREYQYHMLRAQELKIALEGVGYQF